MKEEMVNKYKTQIIITDSKTDEYKTIHGKSIIFIAKHDFLTMEDIFRRYIHKGKVGIYSELSYQEYRIHKMHTQSSRYWTWNRRQISFYHVRESIHSGIQETYNQLKNKIYFPKLLELVQMVINQCDFCKEIKFDRNPIKNKFSKTETPSD